MSALVEVKDICKVYNPGEAITVNIEAVNNTTGITYVLDTVTLDSGKWTTVRVGNFGSEIVVRNVSTFGFGIR